MTVETTNSFDGPYVANGVTVAFPFTFKPANAEEVQVTLDGEVEDPGLYTVTLNAGNQGGTVTYDVAPASGDVIVELEPSFEQGTSFINSGPFLAESHEDALDKAANRAIYLRDRIERSFLLPRVPSDVANLFPVVLADGTRGWSNGTGADDGLRQDLADPVIGGPALIGLHPTVSLGETLRTNAARYGVREAATAAQIAAGIADAIEEWGGRAQPLVIDINPGTYDSDLIEIEEANVWIDAHGSTFTGDRWASSPAATGFRLKNARFYLDTAEAIITLNSSGGGLQNVDLVKFGAGDGYMLVTEGGASDNVFSGLRFTGGNGMFIEGERLLITDVHGVGRAAGGDDFLVFKARNRRTGDISVFGVSAKNYANGYAMGSEIGTLQAASASRAGRVENVNIMAMVLRDCEYGGFHKPGAVDAGVSYDWRDGLIRGVTAQIKMYDADGTKLRRGVVISPARNALIERVNITLHGEGRFANSADTECWAHIFLPDSTGWVGPGAGGTVRGVHLDVTGFDIYGGVDNSGPTPGYPAYHGVSVEKQAAGVGTIERVRVKANIDGTKHSGIIGTPGIGVGTVTIEKFIGRNLANNPGTTAGGIHADGCTLNAPGENEIHMANAASKPIYVAGTGDVVGRRVAFDFNTVAGTGQFILRQMPHAVWLRKATGVPNVSVGADGSHYLSLDFRSVGGTRYDGTAVSTDPYGTKTTAAAGITAFTQFDLAAFGTVGDTYNDRFLAANATVRAAKADTGSGAAFVGSVDLHYVQIGPRV